VNTEVSATSRRCERFLRFECCTVGPLVSLELRMAPVQMVRES